jgi:hypothetical protein
MVMAALFRESKGGDNQQWKKVRSRGTIRNTSVYSTMKCYFMNLEDIMEVK